MKKAIIKRFIGVMLVLTVIGSVAMLAGCGGPKEVTLPDIVGMEKQQAEDALTAVGLTMNVQRERYSDKNPKGTVDKVMVKEGETFTEGDEVKVILSMGEGVTIPNLSVLTGREAESYLKALDLNPILVEEYSDEVEEGYVISYTDAGNTIAVGSDVTVTVSKGPES